MIKYILLFFLKRIIKILNLNKRLIINFTPFKSIYLKLISLILFIGSLFKILKGYAIFRYLTIILRFLSFSSLFINFILFILVLNINIISWDKLYIFNKNLDSNLNLLPTGVKNFIIDWWIKLCWFFKQIWDWFVNYLIYIIDLIKDALSTSDSIKTPSKESIIVPSEGKYGDIQNKDYLNSLITTLDEYKFYILISLGVISIGILTYTFWGKLPFIKKSNNFDHLEGPEDIIPSPDPSLPSTGKDSSDYPDGYLSYFSRRLGDLSKAVSDRAKELFNRSNQSTPQGISDIVSIPKGLYRDGNQVMWKGLPVPRVENLNGRDYYITLDKDNYINMFDSSIYNHSVEIINPITEKGIGISNIPFDGKLDFLNQYNNLPNCVAPVDSITRNLEITNIFVGNPSVTTTSIDLSFLPTFSHPIPIPKGKEKVIDSLRIFH